MSIVHGILLFVLGVGAAFLAYFAWQHAVVIPAAGNGTAAPSTVGNGALVQ